MVEPVEIKVPDIGDFDEVDVIEVLVAVGDQVAIDDSLVTLESDKASMEVPSTHAGTVKSVPVRVGDKVGEGAVIVVLEAAAGASEAEPEEATGPPSAVAAEPPAGTPAAEPVRAVDTRRPKADSDLDQDEAPPPAPEIAVGSSVRAAGAGAIVHASPSVRRFARELGVDLQKVKGSGRKERILADDVRRYVKERLGGGADPVAEGSGIPAVPTIDFSRFGPVEEIELHRIRRVSSRNLHRSWLNVPHVTQFDEADVTELEAFRKELKPEAAAAGVKLTPLAFLLKACVGALVKFPEVNASLAPSGESLILKRYYHLAVAVDTPNGLVVPVIRDVDQKGLFELAGELGEVSARAREGKLRPNDIQGATFTISSLGGIGGTGFTPIVNAPELAILGVARMERKPVWQGDAFAPRLMLPLCLSYDHRVIDGAMGVRFTTYLASVLGDMRRLLV